MTDNSKQLSQSLLDFAETNARRLPDVLEYSPRRFVLEHADGWEISFFYCPPAAEAFIVTFRDEHRLKGMVDTVDEDWGNPEKRVESEKWIPVELARDYWRWLVKCGSKRTK